MRLPHLLLMLLLREQTAEEATNWLIRNTTPQESQEKFPSTRLPTEPLVPSLSLSLESFALGCTCSAFCSSCSQLLLIRSEAANFFHRMAEKIFRFRLSDTLYSVCCSLLTLLHCWLSPWYTNWVGGSGKHPMQSLVCSSSTGECTAPTSERLPYPWCSGKLISWANIYNKLKIPNWIYETGGRRVGR